MPPGRLQAPIKHWTFLSDCIVSQASICAHEVWMGFCEVLTMVPGTARPDVGIVINMFASVSPTNNILHLWSASYVQADTVLDAIHVPSIIIPISKMRKPSLKETSTQVCPGQCGSPARPVVGCPPNCTNEDTMVKRAAFCRDLANPCPERSLHQPLPSLSFLMKRPPPLHTTQSL